MQLKEYECQYCHQHFLTSRGSFSNHIAWCEQNPRYKENLRRKEERLKLIREQSEKRYKEITLNCLRCGKEYTIKVHENDLKSGRYKKYCSRSCANVRIHSEETKQKICQGVKNSEKYKQGLLRKSEEYWKKYPNGNHINKNIKSSKEDSIKKYICGSEQLNKQNPDISCRQSKKWFNNLIPFGFDITSLYTEKIIEEHKKVKDLLYNEYVINEMSPKKIYEKYNCSEYINHAETLLHIFKDWNFPIRSYSKAVVNACLKGDLKPSETPNQYKSEWHTTWDNKEVYLRSSFEKDFAEELDKKQIEYEVEGLRIKYFDTEKNEYRCAIPDFYIPSTNTIIEIKSTWTLEVQRLKDKFKAYKELGYIPKLYLDHEEIDIYSLNQEDFNSKIKYDTEEKPFSKNHKVDRTVTLWVFNDKLRQSIRIPISELSEYEKLGWNKGRKMKWN